jgi:hypothetical protein
MNGTSAQERKSNDAAPLVKLSRMLRSMLRRYPRAHLLNTRDVFGVSLDEHTYMQVSYIGNWTPEVMRDCLALFATWCVADPVRLMRPGEPLVGVSRTVMLESGQYVGQAE